MDNLTSVLESNQLQLPLGDAYLRLQLELKVLSVALLEHIQEVLVLPGEQITLMPSMPDYVLGLMNRRSKVIWVVDLPQMLGLNPLGKDIQQYHIAIVSLENMLLGLAVQQVQGVVRLTVNDIQPSLNDATPNLIPYLRGAVVRQSENLLVLDLKAIMIAPISHHN